MDRRFRPFLEDFCDKNDVVVGAPGVVFYTGEHAVLDGGLAIVQQIPRRIWVGLRYDDASDRTPEEPIWLPRESDDDRIWLPHFDEPQPISKFMPLERPNEWSDRAKAIEKLLNGLLAHQVVQEFWPLDGLPLRVSILSEFRTGSGCNFSGALAAGLLTGIRLVAEQRGFTEARLSAGPHVTEHEPRAFHLTWGGPEGLKAQLRDHNSDLHRINRAALVLETCFHGGSASGYGPLCALVPCRWPMLYMRESPSISV